MTTQRLNSDTTNLSIWKYRNKVIDTNIPFPVNEAPLIQLYHKDDSVLFKFCYTVHREKFLSFQYHH